MHMFEQHLHSGSYDFRAFLKTSLSGRTIIYCLKIGPFLNFVWSTRNTLHDTCKDFLSREALKPAGSTRSRRPRQTQLLLLLSF
jgi:hypothetical protein